MNEQSGQDEEETNQYQRQNEFPYPFYPCGVGYLGHTDARNQHSAGGGYHIGEAVAELECQHGCLSADIDEVGELRHDGHGECCFGCAAGHDEVQQGLEDVHHPY